MFRSLKDSLRRVSLCAISTMLLAGNMFVASAEESGTEPETGATPTTEVIDGIEVQGGGSANIMGYQTTLEAAQGYAVNVKWGGMTFVYDKGTYNTDDGKLGNSAVVTENSLVREAKDGDADTDVVNRWYGFDGENNAVEIENLSTAKLGVTVTPTMANSATPDDKSIVGDTQLELYYGKLADVDSPWTSGGETPYSKTPNHGAENETMYVQEGVSTITGTFEKATFGDNGDPENTQKGTVYLNLAGKPGDSFSTDGTDKTTMDTLGQLTLNFTMPDEATGV